ncbi:hypothetical protein CR513_39405, partial [Mucuna pruriens]
MESISIRPNMSMSYSRNSILKIPKSTSRGRHFIGANLVSWSSKRQGTIALSIAEAENIFQLHNVAHSFCGSSINWRIMT